MLYILRAYSGGQAQARSDATICASNVPKEAANLVPIAGISPKPFAPGSIESVNAAADALLDSPYESYNM
jgi:hypothetical protein